MSLDRDKLHWDNALGSDHTGPHANLAAENSRGPHPAHACVVSPGVVVHTGRRGSDAKTTDPNPTPPNTDLSVTRAAATVLIPYLAKTTTCAGGAGY